MWLIRKSSTSFAPAARKRFAPASVPRTVSIGRCTAFTIRQRPRDLAAAGDRALAAGGRKVAVVGGGLTGLEAVDRRGGQLVLAAKARLRRDLIGIVNWRIAELERLGVDVRLDVYEEVAEVLAEDPDFVFIATGGIPDFGRVIGSEYCLSVFDALGNPKQIADDVRICDATGRHP